jgi:hypothetical protein
MECLKVNVILDFFFGKTVSSVLAVEDEDWRLEGGLHLVVNHITSRRKKSKLYRFTVTFNTLLPVSNNNCDFRKHCKKKDMYSLC